MPVLLHGLVIHGLCTYLQTVSIRCRNPAHVVQNPRMTLGPTALKRLVGGCRPVLFELIGEPIKQSAKLTGEPIKGRVKPALRKALLSSDLKALLSSDLASRGAAVPTVMPNDRRADQAIGKIDRGADQNYR